MKNPTSKAIPLLFDSNHNNFSFTALHGFLGLPSDWDAFPFIDHAENLNTPPLPFLEWANLFNQKYNAISSAAREKKKKILIGYSMGGRLAMYSLLDSIHQWDGAILISANPGFDNKSDRVSRLEADKAWANQFLNDPWDTVIEKWNSQAVFGKNPFRFHRNASQFDREILAKQLEYWSQGQQEALGDKLKNLSIPILVVLGESDPKHEELTNKSRLFAKVATIQNAGHRAPWEQPELFNQQVMKFIKELS